MIQIATLAARYGISTRTLRFYERHGLLTPARKGRNRVYQPKDEARLALIMEAKSLGLTVAKIPAAIEQDADGTERLVITRSMAEQQLRIMRKRYGKALEAVAKLEAIVGERKLPSEIALSHDRSAQTRRA